MSLFVYNSLIASYRNILRSIASSTSYIYINTRFDCYSLRFIIDTYRSCFLLNFIFNMVKSSELTPRKKRVIEVLSQEGYNCTQIAAKVGCSRSAVSRNLLKLKETGTMNNKVRTGRPRISSERDDKVLRRLCMKNRFLTSKQLLAEWQSSTGTTASSSIVRRRLCGMGFRSCKAKQKPILSVQMRRKRLSWAKAHVNWTDEQWGQVIFSDESRFCTISDAPILVRRKSSEAMRPECLQRTTKYPPAVMIWGCISCRGVGRMQFVEKTMDSAQYQKILTDKLLLTAMDHFPESRWIFQQDLAPCHTSKKVGFYIVF